MDQVMGTILYIFEAGGLMIWPLVILLAWGLGIIWVKSQELAREKVIDPKAVEHVEKLLLDNKLAEATTYCRRKASPMTRIILAGIVNYDRNEAELKEILEEAGRQEVPGIRKHLTTLGTISQTAPLMGLLGTVIGMIDVFSVLASGETINATDLAGGISQALVTTACGMVIAVPTLAFYNSFTSIAGNLIVEMEKVSLQMAAVLKRAQ